MDARDPSRVRVLLAGVVEGRFQERLSSMVQRCGWRLDRAPRLDAVDGSVGADVVVVSAGGTEVGDAHRLARALRQVPVVAWAEAGPSAVVAAYLAAGCADVLGTHMGEAEVTARLRGACARVTTRVEAQVSAGPLVVDSLLGATTWDGVPVLLTHREASVAEVLARDHGRAVRREDIYRQVWSSRMPKGDRAVDVNVRRLRSKLVAVAGDGVRIEAISGVGYRLDVESAAPQP